MESNTRRLPIPREIQWFFAAYALGLILYAPTLTAFFFSDELSILAAVAPENGRTWLDAVKPLSNGFYRPLNLLSTRLMIDLFGFRPLVFHLACLCIHALACALTGRLAARMFKSVAAGWLAALLLASHLGAWDAATMYCKTCDALAVVGALAALPVWERWLAEPTRGRFAALIGWFLFALAAKETALVFPIYLLIWMLMLGASGRHGRRAVAFFGGLAVIYAVCVSVMQLSVEGAYLGVGRLTFSPKNFVRQFADYFFSGFIPYPHIVQLPVVQPDLPHALLWIARLLVLGVVGVVGMQFIRRPRGRQLHALVLCAAVGPLLACLLTGPPEARFLYPALPFVCLLWTGLLMASRRRARGALAIALAILWLSFIAGNFASPTLRQYRRFADDVESFTRAAQQVAPEWPRGAHIAIYDHPHPGDAGAQWVYGQLLFNLFVPASDAQLQLDHTTEETEAAYRFDGEALVPMEAEVSR